MTLKLNRLLIIQTVTQRDMQRVSQGHGLKLKKGTSISMEQFMYTINVTIEI